MNIDAGDHFFKIGAEINHLDIYNLFAINATGSLYFSSLADFEEGLLSNGDEFFPDASEVVDGSAYGADINAAPTGDINEAAARFKRSIYSFYAQDEWAATPQLNITAGLRVQLYAGDAPRANPNFQERYGFTNANSFGTLDPVLLPRLSATYDLDNSGFFSNSKITGGVGIFSGGDPVVYFSNAFSNNGFSTGLGTLTSSQCDTLNAGGQVDVVQGGTFTGFPDCVRAAGSAQSAAGLADTQSTNPNFKVPTVTRANLGFSTAFGTEGGFFSDWQMNVDYIYSRFHNTLNFVDLSQTPNITRGLNGFTVDGRPIYAAIDPTDPDAVGCNATLTNQGGTPPVWANVTAACFNRIGRDDEIQLTNGPSYESHIASLLLSKNFRGGLLTNGGGVGLRFGYAFTDSENNRNIGNSTATSSYDNSAAFDRQNPAVSTSNYETRHNITAAVSFREEFFGDLQTKLGIFFRARSGRPYSLTFDGGGVFNDSSSGNENALLYIPTGIDDPNVVYADAGFRNSAGVFIVTQTAAEAAAGFDEYISANKCANQYRGQSIIRNSCENPWHYDVDLRFSQELPGVGRALGLVDDKFELFADFDNFLNFIDKDANRLTFRNDVDVVDGGVDTQGRYVISDYNPNDRENLSISSSAWKIQLGVRYEF